MQAENQAQRAVEKSTMIEREVQKIRENLRGMLMKLSLKTEKLFPFFFV